MSFLSLRDVGFGYPGHVAIVEGLTLELAAGEVHCLVGRSGCGKSTLLKLVAGLLRPTSGSVTVGGGPLADKRQVGYVFQQPTLLDWLSVRDNILLPVRLQRAPSAADIQSADRLLASLGLETYATRHPRQLSGGQQSRVALARALLLRPPLLLLDEPFAALDAMTREALQTDLLGLCRTQATTALFVTHDIAEAVFLGDRVSVLSAGRLVHSQSVPTGAARDTPAFSACCAALRSALEVTGLAP